MGLKSGPASKGKAIHETKPTSALSKHQFITKPENRHGTSHNYSVGKAHAIVKASHGK